MKPLRPLLATLALTSGLLPAAPSYRLHEWGTFTSVSGSDGRVLSGVEGDEEPLPDFVQAHTGFGSTVPPGFKALAGRTLTGVTVKMETPVLYFYADEAFDAEVKVGFKGGTISQWYPTRSGGETLPFHGVDPVTRKFVQGVMDFTEPRAGSIEWKVAVEPLPANWPARVFHPGETPVWLYPRLPASSLVRAADGTTEKYLFYRGVGNFALPFSASFSAARTLSLKNSGPDPIPAVLVYEKLADGTLRWKTLPALAAAGSASLNLDGLAPLPVEKAQQPLHEDLANILMGSGLDRAEADAMILTWYGSYFNHPGLRLFWVVPRPLVDAVLPLSVTPPPAKLERVLLGRLELMSPAMEKDLAEADAAARLDPKKGNPYHYDRHWPAYANRLKQLPPFTLPPLARPE